jgi:hypothetical protein
MTTLGYHFPILRPWEVVEVKEGDKKERGR